MQGPQSTPRCRCCAALAATFFLLSFPAVARAELVAVAKLELPAGQETEVKARESLPVLALPVAENVPVRKGELLAAVDVQKLEKELDGARRTLVSAQEERRRLMASQEVVRGGTNPNSSGNSGAGSRMMEIAAAESDASRDILDVQTRIVTASVRAPEDGYVLKHLYAVASKPKRNKLFLQFAEASRTRLALSVAAAESGGLHAGSVVTIASANRPESHFRARVESATASGERLDLVLKPLELPFLKLGVEESVRLLPP